MIQVTDPDTVEEIRQALLHAEPIPARGMFEPITEPFRGGYPLVVTMADHSFFMMEIERTSMPLREFRRNEELQWVHYDDPRVCIEWGKFRCVTRDNPFTRYLEKLHQTKAPIPGVDWAVDEQDVPMQDEHTLN